MSEVTDDTALGGPIPAFLRGKSPTTVVPRKRRWTRLVAQRPEGDRWAAAERWEITVPPEWSDRHGGLGSGRRYVWALEGRKWAYLRDNESYVIQVPAADWQRAANKGRRVS